MARDYASSSRSKPRNKRSPAARKPSASRRSNSPQAPVRVWRWYGSGVATGVFLSLLLYLVTLPPTIEEGSQTVAETAASKEREAPPKPRFDFYTMLPEQSIDVDVEPADIAQPRASSNASNEIYILQAGSFRQRQDADRRRAELLLLGLEPKIEESRTDNGRWFRVFIGPYDSRAQMAKARSLTAGQNIDTLLLKRSR